MGLVIDTDVWILAEKAQIPLDLSRWHTFGGAYLSAITASELLGGVERASSAAIRAKRSAFVERILNSIPILEFNAETARTHARMLAAVPKNRTAGAHDAIIAATAIHLGYAVLTRNVADFEIFAGLDVQGF
jgi:tRNA(fMet)-specific endonuclease VapC